jgi:POT family proton-dependent oligopeptide transporter
MNGENAINGAPTWFGHPRGLTVLFLTNMWEQFSYYGMRALLVYFMTRQLMLGQAQASLIYGAYTACAYFTPIIGGMLAGHFMMAFEPLFYAALATIALGNGLFLPTLPSQVGDLYRRDDPRRGWAYNVYYVGINIGGFLAPVACGTIGELYGWHYGFGLAGLGMLTGLLIYLSGSKHLPPDNALERPAPDLATSAAPAAFDRSTVLMLIAIGVAVTVFRSAYEQVGNTVALWSDAGVDRHAGSLVIPMTWFQSLNPLFVMLMTPPLLAYWRRRADAGADQAPALRMATGALILSAAYLLLAGLVWLGEADGGRPTPWPWLVLFFAAFTFGELFILPTGLGLFAKLAPPGRATTTVGAWFLIIFSGSLSAGMVGSLWGRLDHSAFFALLAALAAVSALMLRLLHTSINKQQIIL